MNRKRKKETYFEFKRLRGRAAVLNKSLATVMGLGGDRRRQSGRCIFYFAKRLAAPHCEVNDDEIVGCDLNVKPLVELNCCCRLSELNVFDSIQKDTELIIRGVIIRVALRRLV